MRRLLVGKGTDAVLNLLDLSGRRILVTGASSGIGRQTAITLSELGARLILTGRDAGRLEATKQRLAGEAHVVEPFDLSQGDAILGWLKKVTDAAGPLRGLVHCAAIQSLVPLRVMTAAAMESMYRANAVSAALLVRAFQQRDCFSPPASIVLVASTAAFLGVPANAAYGATKAAIMSMCRSFALEVVDRGIRVNCVAPGLVETEMV